MEEFGKEFYCLVIEFAYDFLFPIKNWDKI